MANSSAVRIFRCFDAGGGAFDLFLFVSLFFFSSLAGGGGAVVAGIFVFVFFFFFSSLAGGGGAVVAGIVNFIPFDASGGAFVLFLFVFSFFCCLNFIPFGFFVSLIPWIIDSTFASAAARTVSPFHSPAAV